MKVGALIPARIGSKRLPKKNIIDLGGKPLICWTIDTLLEADVFDRITVSTESEDVSEVVRSFYGSKVSILKRPEELAGDDSSLEDVQQHYLDNNPDIEWFGLFMPTYPFRKAHKISDSVRALYSGYAWRVISVRSEENCSLDYYYPKEDGVGLFYEMQPFFAANNISAYLFYRRDMINEMWVKAGMTNTERVKKIYADLDECIDIDTAEDLDKAKKIAAGAKPFYRSPVITEYGDWTLLTPTGVDIDAYKDFLNSFDLDDHTLPILFLEEARLSVSTFRCFDGIRRSYWLNDKAMKYMNYRKAKKTGNNAHMPLHYKNSSHYRLLRNFSPDNPNCPPKHCDRDGIMDGTNSGLPIVIPNKRVIYEDQVKNCHWYVDPLDFSDTKD